MEEKQYRNLFSEDSRDIPKLKPPPDLKSCNIDPLGFDHHPLLHFRLQKAHEMKHFYGRVLAEQKLFAKVKEKAKYDPEPLSSPFLKDKPERPQYMHQEVLKREAGKIDPPHMLLSWLVRIWERVPVKLIHKYPAMCHEMENYIVETYDSLIYKLGVCGLVKPMSGDPCMDVKIKPYGTGVTENYSQFLAKKRHLERRLFITHPIIRKIICICDEHTPELFIDFKTYRKQGIMTLSEWKNILLNDFVDNDYALKVNLYDKVVEVVKDKTLSHRIVYFPRFMRLATFIITCSITQMLMRTLDNYVDMTRNLYEVPYLSIDFLFEDVLGIIQLPPKMTVIKSYVKVVDDILNVAQKLRKLESHVYYGVKNNAYMTIKLLEDYVHNVRCNILVNTGMIYSSIDRYRNDLVDQFAPLYEKELGAEIADFLKTTISFRKHCHKMQHLREFYQMIMIMVENEYFEHVMVNQSKLIEMMMSFFNHYSGLILNTAVDQQQHQNKRLCERFENVANRVLTPPKSTEELVQLGELLTWASTEFMEQMKGKLLQLLDETAKTMEWTTMTDVQIQANSVTMMWVVKMKEILRQSASLYEQCRFDFMEILAQGIDKLNTKLDLLFKRLVILDMMDDPNNAYEYGWHLRDFDAQLRKCDKMIDWINKEEALFQIALSTFPGLDELRTIIHQYAEVVAVVNKWRKKHLAWKDGDFEFINYREVEEVTEDCHKDLMKLQKTFRNRIRQQIAEEFKWRLKGKLDDMNSETLPSVIKLCLRTIDEIKAFRPHVPLVVILCNPDLRPRHWVEINEVAGFDLTPDAGTTLRKLIEMHLEEFVDKFEIISIGATKEKQLKENLDKMLLEWTDLRFTVNMWKDTKIAILSQLDDIQAVMDDHYVKTLAMRGSAFVKPFEEEVLNWYTKLVRMMKTVEEWGKVQAQWLYLLPIFTSPDIIAQMPEEGRLFKDVDQTYVRLMTAVQKDSRVTETAGALGVYENLQRCTQKLEKINDGVASYLEKKRLYFPRFFFLSNDEMLEILSETKDPKRVQPHLKKCFEGINKLTFTDELKVLSMISAEGEVINLVEPINVKEAGGSVEKWLIQVEEQMILSVAFEVRRSHRAYLERPRKKWVLEWAGQVVLCVGMIYWTIEVHDLLKPNGVNALQKHHLHLQEQLNDIVSLVRGKLTKLERITLGALVVLDVHAKDVTEELVIKKVQSSKDFQWLAQLRYYMEAIVKVRIINATVNYAYEYLGNTPRLVITPLTDRCYRTLIGAYHLHLNGAPEGPAGTGKTETTKDLAKALAVQCVVFNCSDGLDYIAMGKFFKGLASTGAWACFDEFNRIELEVLSVIAQQILCIVQAVRAGLKKFVFEGTELNLNPACYVCITMNPGYAGRSELPDNLKVLFRTVAMMVPDYALIGEISLYSYGFVDARSLSVKIVTTYRLCSEQLSSQNHYDYGMRAVKTVLAAAGNLKLKFPDEKEDILLLRSIIDVNLPKFLSHDVPLFEGIISDLFPSVVLPTPNYDIFLKAAKKACQVLKLQNTEIFMIKVIQTYEMMIVRHGFMLVGEPFGGKTSCLKTLAGTLANMEEQGEPENRVQFEVINPKAVTMGQLYGQFDPVSYEWTDGIVATIFRRFSNATVPDRKWIIFDGPVDAVWIENMNTVLDDNKKLCLTSGEVIQQTSQMSMIFEVMDLAQASPATVSRCGMIYMEPSALGWKVLVQSWLQSANPAWREGNEKLLEDMFDWLVPPCLDFIKRNCHMLSNGGVSNTIMTCIHLVTMLLDEAISMNQDTKNMDVWVQAAFMYAGVWGFGGALDNESREKFDYFFRSMWKQEIEELPIPESVEKIEVSIPFEGTLYDYVYSFKQKGNWRSWPEQLKGMKTEETINIQQTVVPTIESVRVQYLMQKHIENNLPMLVVGPTGTGKSFYMQDMLMNKLPGDVYVPSFITFTAQTTANQTQDLVISKLVKRRRGIYGPPKGMKSVILIDDMNMPAKEIYGAQPAIELIRQFFDHKHWYDLKDTSKIFLLDVLMLAAMGLPGGSRQDVYRRFLRHFCIYSIDAFSNESMTKIYTNILLIGLRRNGFGTDAMTSINNIIGATLEIYQAAIRELLPTPAKSHYIFNLRDFSRVIQGCALLKKESVENRKIFIRLWVHEVLRVFCDRLIDDSDRLWLFEKIKVCVQDHFKEKFDMAMDNLPTENGAVTEMSLRYLMFGNFMDPDAIEEDRKYEEIPSVEAFIKIASDAMDEYNATHKAKMDIVLFRYALEHLSRICRIIAMPCGSGLLVGVGGSGRQSLSKLASVIYGTQFFQPEITKNYGLNEWRDDIKKVLRQAGGLGKDTTFLFTEAQIKEEAFLQDIESILNSGEVPNLYAIDEQQEILELVRLAAQGGNRNLDITTLSVFSFFINRCKQRLHMLLCFSPIGSAFRNRLRLYPSLVNCCTIDWFMTWPEEALEMVAERYMTEVNVSDDVKASAVIACKYFHVCARQISDTFFAKEGRKTYITSAAYLELIRSFTELNTEKQNEIMENKMRYIGGLEKLLYASEQIVKMKADLSALRPELEESTKNQLIMLKNIEQEQENVNSSALLVKQDEIVANAQAEAAQALKSECEKDLEAAIPVLEDALAALETLKQADITLVKSMKNPPAIIKMVMNAVCVMKDIKPARIRDPSTGKMINDYWGPSQKLLGDMNFRQSLKDYDKDNINPEIMKKIRKEFLPDKNFVPQIVAKASSAAEGLVKWIIAMDVYDQVIKVVAPKKEKLRQAEETYNATMALLDAKREELENLRKKLKKLQKNLNDAQEEKKKLEAAVNLCITKLERAEKLIGGLGGEKSRWEEAAANLQKDYDCLPGDILICCGTIGYLSPYTSTYRTECIEDWHSYVKNLKIPCSPVFSLRKILGSDIKIQEWNIAGLPRDAFSTDNAIIVDKSRRYSLLIDPQEQANRWVKIYEKNNGLCIVKLTDPTYMNTLHECMENGLPALIENIGEVLEAPLEPILQKNLFTQGGKKYIKLGETVLEFSPGFRLYMTSKLRNPHYLPEVINLVTLVNFALTLDGLADQLLGMVVAKERSDLEEIRQKLIIQSAVNEAGLKDAENKILITISQAKNILEDSNAIDILDSSKALSVTIAEKQETAKLTAKNIEKFRLSYSPVAQNSAVLYYCVSDLPNVDPMYQYSLQWFLGLFNVALATSKQSKEIKKRMDFIENLFTMNLYSNVCRSLFEKDKLLFSFVLCTNIMMAKNKLDMSEFRFFLTGGVALENKAKNPAEHWLPQKSWDEICRMIDLPVFKDFMKSFLEALEQWQSFYDDLEPQDKPLPPPWSQNLSSFQKLIMIRVLRPDKILVSITKFIKEEMGIHFVTPPPFNIAKSYGDSNRLSPLIFILSPGADPMGALLSYAEKMDRKLNYISLGQGQGPIAAELIERGQEEGSWVCLQNCHLAVSWMPSLEKLWELMDISNTHPNFRLWITSYPSDKFPTSILQAGVKMTNEPPTGLQQNLLRSYMSEPVKEPEFYEGCPVKPIEFAKLLYGLCFFHAVVQERRKFGSIGWNIPYGFNESDFQISVLQLQMFINEQEKVPFDAITYLTGECNYGGRVTDDWDRRALNTILANFINTDVISLSKYLFCDVGPEYGLPEEHSYDDYVEHIKKIPVLPPVDVFGLHMNAGITRDLLYSRTFLDSLLLVHGGMASGAGGESDSLLYEIAKDILMKLPPSYDIEEAMRRYPVKYEESMNTVLVQEMDRFNKLLNTVRSNLVTVQKAVKGFVVMSPELEAVANSLMVGKVPGLWAKVSYPSLKPLGGYVSDFLQRLDMLQSWFENGKPNCYWLPGFFFTQAFLTGVMQNFARKYKIPIDHLTFDFAVTEYDFVDMAAPDGCFVHGLFLDGARWDKQMNRLTESLPKILWEKVPAILVCPLPKEELQVGKRYICPLYKTSERRGVLSTTGHSTNYVLPFLLDTERPVAHWIKRGVAMVCQLDD